jgi:hypothetical protein
MLTSDLSKVADDPEIKVVAQLIGGIEPVAALIGVADTADATCYLALFEDASGNLAPKTDAGATYAASTGTLTTTAATVTGAHDGSAAKLACILYGTADPGAGFLATPIGSIYIKHAV